MKKVVLLFVCVTFTQLTFSQQDIDPRLVEFIGAENVQTYQNQFPDKLAYYQYVLENVVLVQDMGAKDVSGYPDVSQIAKHNPSAPDLNEQTDFSAINPFHYNFGNQTEQKIFRIGNTSMALVARPESFLRKEYLKTNGE